MPRDLIPSALTDAFYLACEHAPLSEVRPAYRRAVTALENGDVKPAVLFIARWSAR